MSKITNIKEPPRERGGVFILFKASEGVLKQMEPPLRKVLLVREAKKRQQPTFSDAEVERGFMMIQNWEGYTHEHWKGWKVYYGVFMKEWETQMMEERKGIRKAQRDTIKFIEKL